MQALAAFRASSSLRSLSCFSSCSIRALFSSSHVLCWSSVLILLQYSCQAAHSCGSTSSGADVLGTEVAFCCAFRSCIRARRSRGGFFWGGWLTVVFDLDSTAGGATVVGCDCLAVVLTLTPSLPPAKLEGANKRGAWIEFCGSIGELVVSTGCLDEA